MSRPVAPHVQAAIQASGWSPPRPAPAPAPAAPAAQGALPVQASGGALERYAGHVQRAIQFKGGPEARGGEAPRGGAASDFVIYDEKKLGGAPPPPPRQPVYTLHCDDKGGGCSLQDVTTGRVKPAGDLYAGFVRMGKGSPVYLSPRPGAGLQGDSHPTIATRTPEWQRGQRAVVAGGELGILGGQVVGHNDKTGHFQSRKNRYQSGLPADRFHPFTEDPGEWYKVPG